MQFYNEALNQIHLLSSQNLSSLDEDCIRMLNGLLQKPSATAATLTTKTSQNTSSFSTNARNESESSECEQQPSISVADNDDVDDKTEACNAKSKEPKRFPFKQVYD